MTSAVPLLAAVFSAVVGGALTVALLVLLPLLMNEPLERYPDTNTFVLRRMDTTMPLLAVVAIVLSVAAAVLNPVAGASALHVAGAAGLLVLLVVSALVLRRVNDAIAARPDTPALRVLRHRWRGWHLTRVAAALAAVVANTGGAVLVVP